MLQSQLIEFPEIFKSVRNTLSGICGIIPVFGLEILDNFEFFCETSSDIFCASPNHLNKFT